MAVQINNSDRIIGKPLVERIAYASDSETLLVVIRTQPGSLVKIDVAALDDEEEDDEENES